MKAYLTKRYWFAASHRLHNDNLSADENRRIYGKCNNPFGHGHNYALEVTVCGPVDPRTGMVCDLAELDAAVTREVLERFDHENLNTRRELADAVPTSEMLAERIFAILRCSFHAAELYKVRLEETTQNAFEYAGGREFRQ
jgi:6-pyruvoyltetrahydropterin/6-carboxytetrahydropterin synthase